MRKLINNFTISEENLTATSSSRSLSISGDDGAMFDLEVKNSAGKYYNFILQEFKTAITTSTAAASSCATENSNEVPIISANSNIKVGMFVTGDGIEKETVVTGLKAILSSNPDVIVLSNSCSIPKGATLTFKAPANLTNQEIKGNLYSKKIVFPTVTSNNNYTLQLTALHDKDTYLDALEPEVDLNPQSSNFGEFLTTGFRNDLFKSITIYQYINTAITINMSSSSLTTLDVDFSANTFDISQPRSYTSSNTSVSTTSFSWPITVPSSSAIVKSQPPLATYFETLKTHTVNGAVSNNLCIVLDSVEHIAVGMKISAVSSGSVSGTPVVKFIDVVNKKITVSATQSFADGVTLTFKALGIDGPNAYGAEISFTNLKIELTPLTVTVASSHSGSSATVIPLVSASGIQDGSSTIIKGVGVDVDTSLTNIATRASGSNNITLSSAKVIEAGAVLTVEGTSTAATITGDVILRKIGDTNFTTTLNLDNFVGIGVS